MSGRNVNIVGGVVVGNTFPGLRIGVIGAGRVGPSVASALRAGGQQVAGVTARSQSGRERAAAMLPGVPLMDPRELVATCDLVLLAVPDREIGALATDLTDSWRPGQLVVHLSGARGPDVLAPAAERGALTMSLHPVMTFTGTSLDVQRLQGTPVAVTAPALAIPLGEALVRDWGGVPFILEESAKPLYHAALSHGANHLVTLISQAQDLLSQAGIEEPGTVMEPLVRAALEGALQRGMGALTGPVVRGDQETIAAHGRALRGTEAAPTYDHMHDVTVRAWQEQLEKEAAEND